MGRSNARQVAIERRQSFIAALLVQNPYLTYRQIYSLLAGDVARGGLRNPRTNKPYSLGIIHKDVHEIREGWRQSALKDTDEWVAEILADYREIKKLAYAKGDLQTVLRVLGDTRRMLGLDAPSLIAPTTPKGDEPYEPKTGVTSIFVIDDSTEDGD